MSDALKALSRETKALIVVSEFEAKRMPLFQLRAVLDLIVRDDAERKVVIDLVDSDLRATGYPIEQITAFLNDLLAVVPAQPIGGETALVGTRKLRSPFSQGFDGGALQPLPGSPLPRGTTSALINPRASDAVAPAVSALPPVAPGSAPPGLVPPSPLPPPLHPVPSIAPLPPLTPSMPMTPPPSNAAPALPPPASTPRRSTFVFQNKPLSPVPPDPDQAPERKLKHEVLFGAKPPGFQMSAPVKPVVVLADDDKRARMVYRMRLEDAGVEVVEFGDGAEAWARIQAGGVALAVLDMKMPGMHGLDVLTNLAAKFPGLPVVICSAYDQLEDELAVQRYSPLKYLTKPVAPDRLVATVKELLGAQAR